MAMVRCRECKTEVSSDAKSCPKCGTPHFRPGWTKNPTLNTGCAVLLLSMMTWCGIGALRRSHDPAVAVARRAEQPAMVVENRKLWNDYEANEVAADNAYRGKRLKVVGAVASIDKHIGDKIVLRLVSPNEFMSTMASMESSEASRAAVLSKGARIAIACTGGGRIVGTPMLNDCVFVE